GSSTRSTAGNVRQWALPRPAHTGTSTGSSCPEPRSGRCCAPASGRRSSSAGPRWPTSSSRRCGPAPDRRSSDGRRGPSGRPGRRTRGTRCTRGELAPHPGALIASRRPSGADVRPKEVPTTAPRRRIESALALALVLGLLAGGPALADTKSDLDRAKQELAQLQVRLSAATAAWQAAVSRLAQTREQIAATRAEIDALRSQVERIQQRLQRRAVIAFETGPATTIDLLLSSQTFTEFSDRMEFLGNVVQNDSDLVLEREVTEEQLRRQEQRLASLGIQQADAAQQLASSRSAIAADTAAVQQTVSELEKKLKQEQQLLRVLGQTPHMGAPIAVCPVRGPNSFVDSFGWPRPGGRVHEG